MKHIQIIDTPTEFLIELEIIDENNFDLFIATHISLHSLISGKNLTDGFTRTEFGFEFISE